VARERVRTNSSSTAGTWAQAAAAAACLLGALAAAPQAALAKNPVEIEGSLSGEQLEQVRAALPDRDPPETLFDAQRIAEEAAQRITALLRALGYYAPTIEARAEQEPLQPVVAVEPGPLYRFAAPKREYVAADGPAPEAAEQAVRAALAPIEAGEPARAALVLAAEGAAVAALKGHGYPKAAAAERLVVVDHADRSMIVTLRLQPGPRVRLNGVRVAEGVALRQDYLDNLQDWRPGAPYNPDALLSLRRDVAAAGAFDSVGVELAQAENPDGTTDVVLSVEPAKPYQLSLGASYSTTEGGGGAAGYLFRNITRRADTLDVQLVAAELQQSLTATWRRPNALGRGRTLALLGEVIREDVLPFTRQGVRVAAAFEPRQDVRLARSFGGEISVDIFDDAPGVANAVVLNLFGAVRYATTDSALDPRHGFVLEARAEPSVSTGDATVLFARSTASASAYWTPGSPLFTLAARFGLGWVQPLAGDAARLPLNRLFFAGGGGSVRGFQFRSIFPSAGLGQETPPGGRGLFEGSLEGRLRFTSRLGAAVFVDSGAAFNDVSRVQPVYGAGFGLRYDLGFGPLRIDLARPLSDAPNAPEVAFYFSLGQAF
jgi:translocation and assembly module TamA